MSEWMVDCLLANCACVRVAAVAWEVVRCQNLDKCTYFMLMQWEKYMFCSTLFTVYVYSIAWLSQISSFPLLEPLLPFNIVPPTIRIPPTPPHFHDRSCFLDDVSMTHTYKAIAYYSKWDISGRTLLLEFIGKTSVESVSCGNDLNFICCYWWCGWWLWLAVTNHS